jgi:hypothetical protein
VKALGVLLVTAGLLATLSACGSGGRPVAPSKNASYAWQPVTGGPRLVCTVSSQSFHQFVGYEGRMYVCKVPAPADKRGGGSVDFFGPTTVAAGSIPLAPGRLRLEIVVFAPRAALLRVDFGDGTHWQREVMPGNRTVNVVHDYRPGDFLLVTLRDKDGYLAAEGEGPLGAPTPGPRTRYCGRVTEGKGGTLSATPSLGCAEARKLFAAISPRGKLSGYRCRESGLPPEWSDVFLDTCTRGSRALVFTSNP